MIYNIQGLRLLAAFFIVLAHIILFGNEKYSLNQPGLDKPADFFMIGVDIFFIISGFIMIHTRSCTNSASENSASTSWIKDAIHFFYKRATRIYPVYWLLCLALLPIFFLFPGWINSGADEPTSLFHSFFLIPHKSVPLIMVAWTLEYEMFFYLVFALTIGLTVKKQIFTLTCLFAALVLAGIGIPSLQDSAPLALITSSFLLYFIAGMWLAYLYNKLPHSKLAIALVAIALILSIYCASFYKLGEIDRFMHFGCTAILIVTLTLMFERAKIIGRKSIMLWGGNISYSLYLLLVLALSACGRFIAHFIDAGPMLATLFCIASITSSLIGATVLFYLFERPVMKLLRRIEPFKIRSAQ